MSEPRSNNHVQIESFAAWILAAQIAGGFTTVSAPPPEKPATSVLHQSQAINAALNLLRQVNSPVTARIITISKRPEFVSKNAEAYALGKGFIYILTDTPLYKNASRGDGEAIIKLASVIAHEQVHADGVADEKAAYEQQLTILRRMNAPEKLCRDVMFSLHSVSSKR